MIAEICIRPWKFHVEPFRIAGNLYYVGNKDVSSHLIDTGEGLILIDTAFPQSVYLLLESVRRLGFNPDDIVYILHCHGHYDHFGGTKAIVELTGAKTFLGREDIEILEKKPELSWAPEYGMKFREVFNVDTPLSGGEVIKLGNISIESLHIPGHTPGSMSYFFEINEKERKLKVGIHGGPGLNTLTDSYLKKYGLPLSRRDDYMNSLALLKKQKVDIFIGAHPGQNNTLGKRALMSDKKNPFIDREAWSAFLKFHETDAKKEFGF
jgi:metallo-beta-lactamase class B